MENNATCFNEIPDGRYADVLTVLRRGGHLTDQTGEDGRRRVGLFVGPGRRANCYCSPSIVDSCSSSGWIDETKKITQTGVVELNKFYLRRGDFSNISDKILEEYVEMASVEIGKHISIDAAWRGFSIGGGDDIRLDRTGRRAARIGLAFIMKAAMAPARFGEVVGKVISRWASDERPQDGVCVSTHLPAAGENNLKGIIAAEMQQ